MADRKYLPTFGELIDKLSVLELKYVFLGESNEEYRKVYAKEIQDILYDIDSVIKENNVQVTAKMLRAVCILGQMNLHIWMGESNARKGEQNSLEDLKKTHSLNGIRCLLKNIIEDSIGSNRKDLKIDVLDPNYKGFMPSNL